MDKFLRALIITCLVVITLVLLGFEYVLSVLPVRSKSGSNMIAWLWGGTALSVFLIVVFSRMGTGKQDGETLDLEKKAYPDTPEEWKSDPRREKSRIIFMVLAGIAMLAVLGIGIYTMW